MESLDVLFKLVFLFLSLLVLARSSKLISRFLDYKYSFSIIYIEDSKLLLLEIIKTKCYKYITNYLVLSYNFFDTLFSNFYNHLLSLFSFIFGFFVCYFFFLFLFFFYTQYF